MEKPDETTTETTTDALDALGEAASTFGIPFANLPTLSYQVLSDNFAGKSPGETVTEDELEGCNIAALIEGGHLARVVTASAEKKEK